MRGDKAVKGLSKNYKKSEAYIHLSHAERLAALREIADKVGSWTDARAFGDVQLKRAHVGDPEFIRELAFEQVVTRFNTYLEKSEHGQLGMIVHDQNQTASLALTKLMRGFHRRGTAWTSIDRIIETPLFVDSSLTAMVQVADLIAYAVRRFADSGENDLFDRVYSRFDRVGAKLVGLRHYTGNGPCTCRICVDHQRMPPPSPSKTGA